MDDRGRFMLGSAQCLWVSGSENVGGRLAGLGQGSKNGQTLEDKWSCGWVGGRQDAWRVGRCASR